MANQARPIAGTTAKGVVVITTIAGPNPVMRQIAADCAARDLEFIAVGDTKSPADFALAGCDFLSVDAQRALGLRFGELCPVRHYARKNVGYLVALSRGADHIIETDDDNFPREGFYDPLPYDLAVPVLRDTGWVNLYRYYLEDGTIWPRGLPLDAVRGDLPELPAASPAFAPIQQGLADDNPDVDAIYRLTMPLPITFEGDLRVAIGNGSWCPYNSQNTIHLREAFPLLYLPAHCSFRMTDIWRSFVAQRIAWANGWSILFREATVRQERNDHDLMRDFADEIPGYLNNRAIAEALAKVAVEPGPEGMLRGLTDCYGALIAGGWVGAEEAELVDAWIADLRALGWA